MSRKIVRIILFSGLSFLVLSCASLSTLEIEVLRPASYSVSPEILSVVIVDNSLPFRGNKVHSVSTLQQSFVVDTIWIDDFGKIATNAFTASLKEKNFFDSVFFHDIPVNRGETELARTAMPRELIDSLCRKYNAQAVIALDSIRYSTTTNFSDLGDIYYLSLDVKGMIYWKMYREGAILMDSYMQKDSIFWDNTTSSFNRAANRVPTIRESVETMAKHMGQKAVRRVAPFWEPVNRYLFSGNNFFFTRAFDLQAAGNWEEAAKVWFHVFENGTKRQKARAAFNIALSHEVRGNFDEAVAWGDISRQLFDELGFFNSTITEKNISKYYYIELNSRNQQIKKLEEQLGPMQ